MSYDEPNLRAVMDLEGVKRWLPGDKSGYADLTEAMREQGLLRDGGHPRRSTPAGHLELGGGLEVLVAAALGGVAARRRPRRRTPSRAVAYELPAWARIAGHEASARAVEPPARGSSHVRRGAVARRARRPAPTARRAARRTAASCTRRRCVRWSLRRHLPTRRAGSSRSARSPSPGARLMRGG